MGYKRRDVKREEQPEIYEHIDAHIGKLFRLSPASDKWASKYDGNILILLKCELFYGMELYYLYDLVYHFLNANTNEKMRFHVEVIDDFFETFGKYAECHTHHFRFKYILEQEREENDC